MRPRPKVDAPAKPLPDRPPKPPVREKLVKHRWGKTDPTACCKQTTHQLDRHAAEPTYLHWAKSYRTVDGVERPAGGECYGCFDMRRSYMPQYLNVQTLREARDDCEELDQKCEDLRKDKVSGEKHLAGQRVDADAIQRMTSKVSEQLGEQYNEGTFKSIALIARERRLEYEDDAELEKYLTNELGMAVFENDVGVRGVEFVDGPAGQYRFKHGVGQRVDEKQRGDTPEQGVGGWCLRRVGGKAAWPSTRRRRAGPCVGARGV